ncbi:XrtA/PEP-CTERM system histidine kinase PrsK [Sphingomonas sp. XXL09]|uniref:XrtA/PEP-CTERM system histidine kinase PrsK n=1 Tax=Sphingomonas sp. XXL09 TaxID=3457787 RepID=UPI00406BA9EC
MTLALTLWSHALAALGFGLLAVAAARGDGGLWGRLSLAGACALTACWALAVAGINARDPATALAETARNLAWLGLLWQLGRRDRGGSAALLLVYLVTGAINIGAVLLALIQTLPLAGDGAEAAAGLALVARMVGALLGLVLAHQYAVSLAAGERRGVLLLFTAAIAGMWTTDLALAVLAYSAGWPDAMVAVRGFAMIAMAMLMAPAVMRAERPLAMSHAGALRLLTLFAVILYVGLTVGLIQIVDRFAGSHGRIAQTAIVCGAAAALGTLLTAPWLRGWAKVKLAQHFFRHRYDYRVEWQRFATRLGRPGAEPLGRRIVRAIADLTSSPAALLLVCRDGELEPDEAWNWPMPFGGGAALVAYLAASERIVSLDELRRAQAPAAEAAAVPAWMVEDEAAWALVPLLHGSELAGAILLARPAASPPLDWEDLDLLRIAGRQAASYLAEERAHAALAEAARFDEFNRRFAFIMHDIKNLVSGVSLVARNAERHADNPAFRADMIATLQDSAARMNALLARLSQHHQGGTEPVQPVDVGTLAARLAERRRAQHSIEVAGQGIALAQPHRLEQLLDHLVQNAVEASPPDRAVRLTVSGDRAAVSIDVEDEGCGMSAAFIRERLFRPFASSKPAGFGIGAYEARQLAQAMGGTIDVTSREGAGSRFRVRLPAAPAQSLDQAA